MKAGDGVQHETRQFTAFDSSGAFHSNATRTRKYTWWSFLPLNLWEQFHKPLNIYFLVIVIVQSIHTSEVLSSHCIC